MIDPKQFAKKIRHCLNFAWLSYYCCRRHIADVYKDNKVCTLVVHLLTQNAVEGNKYYVYTCKTEFVLFKFSIFFDKCISLYRMAIIS